MQGLAILSPGELAVYGRRRAGMRNAEIAAALGISRHAVAVHYHNAAARLRRGAKARTLREQREALRRFDEAAAREPRCSRCQIRGHEAGDPERCLSIYAVARARMD